MLIDFQLLQDTRSPQLRKERLLKMMLIMVIAGRFDRACMKKLEEIATRRCDIYETNVSIILVNAEHSINTFKLLHNPPHPKPLKDYVL